MKNQKKELAHELVKAGLYNKRLPSIKCKNFHYNIITRENLYAAGCLTLYKRERLKRRKKILGPKKKCVDWMKENCYLCVHTKNTSDLKERRLAFYGHLV